MHYPWEHHADCNIFLMPIISPSSAEGIIAGLSCGSELPVTANAPARKADNILENQYFLSYYVNGYIRSCYRSGKPVKILINDLKDRTIMLKKLYNGIRYHFYTIQFVEWLLTSPLFLKNPFYQLAIKRGIRQTRNSPVELLIELTNACNLACVMCPHAQMKRGRGVMSRELFRKIIDEASDLDIRSIKLAGLGEPLLDRDIAEKIAYAKMKNLCVKMFTNGMLLDQQRSQQLIQAGVDEIFISIDGGTPLVQETIRKGSSFSQLQANLGYLNDLRREMKASGKRVPEVIINVTYQEANKNERRLIRNNWGDLVDNIRLFPIHNWEVAMNVPKRASQPCHLPFFQMAVCWDGRIALCCIDYECQHQLGDVTKESIASIWRGTTAMEFRKLHLDCKPETIDLCRSCSMLPNWFFSAGL